MSAKRTGSNLQPIKAHRSEGKSVAPPPPSESEEEEDEEEEFDFDEEEEFDADGLEDDDEEFDEEEFDEADDEEGSGNDDDDSDSDAQSHIDVNWDAREMFTRHIDAISGNIDSSIPDGENLVDRRDFGTCVKKSVGTILTTVMEIEEDDASDVSVDTAEVMEDEDTYGVTSFVPLAAFASKFPSCQGVLTLLGREPEFQLVAGPPPVRFLASPDGSPARALLFFNDHVNVVPPTVVAQVIGGSLGELETALAAKNHDGVDLQRISHVVVLARVQRSATGSSSAVKGEFDLANNDFLRWEDEAFYRNKDPRIGVQVFKFPRVVEGQDEADVPRCVAFAMTLEAFRSAVKALPASAAALEARTAKAR